MSHIRWGDILFEPKELGYEKVESNKWEITDKLECIIETKSDEQFFYTINPGVTTDFRSGPGVVDNIAPKIGNFNISMSWLIHDINYWGYLPRISADRLLYTMLKRAGLKTWRCKTVFLGVRIFGIIGYKKTKNKKNIEFNKVDSSILLSEKDA